MFPCREKDCEYEPLNTPGTSWKVNRSWIFYFVVGNHMMEQEW